jgi:hypothetical protein
VTPGSSGTPLIRTPDQRLRVFVSSTLGELADERRAAAAAISALGLTPVMFEQGARPQPPQDLYRAYLAQSDVFVGLYWQSYGQVPTGSEISGLEEEFELSQDLPRLLYTKVPAPDREPGLEQLMARIRQEASYRKFGTSDELEALLRNDLATLLSERFAADPGAERPSDRASPKRRSPDIRRQHASLTSKPDAEVGFSRDRVKVALGTAERRLPVSSPPLSGPLFYGVSGCWRLIHSSRARSVSTSLSDGLNCKSSVPAST